MSLLKDLKVVANTNNQTRTVERLRRDKLITKLQEQLALAEAQSGGTAYKRMKWITTASSEGEPVRVQRPVRLKQWWYKNLAGSILLTVRYGAKPLVISNGMTAIELASLNELPSTISTVIKAVDAGELDGELSQVAALKARHLNKTAKSALKK